MGVSLTKLHNVSFNSLISSESTMQAQHFAKTKMDYLIFRGYNNLASQAKTSIAGTQYSDSITVGTESTNADGIKQRVVSVKVYSGNENQPRASLEQIFYSNNPNMNAGVPSGTVLSWYGNVANMPSGFVLCDGSNGTPDLRDRFIVGAGSAYTVGNTGGVDNVTLTIAQMPSHNHSAWTDSQGDHYHASMGENDPNSPFGIYAWGSYCGSRGGIDWDNNLHKTSTNGAHAHNVGIANAGNSQAHENRPPYYALYYIMKL